MGGFSKLVQTNIMLSIFFTVVAFGYPVFNEAVFYKNKKNEATSVCGLIAKVQEDNYQNKNSYIPLKKGDISTLVSKFNIKKTDLEFYDYSIVTYFNKYEIVAEPKVKYLKSREIAPLIYTYSQTSDSLVVSKEWK
ncbi:MAG: hypothetical protein U9N59_07175 [Campylobacterota bacterium]|nr:hypothetical protein [Campylobacterota bacterium]